MSSNKKEEGYITITVTLPQEYIDFLKQQMKLKDQNRSQVIRAALRKLMTEGE
jgi:Arc/MetJ-type ribon-helix-helix transcriptional regulator